MNDERSAGAVIYCKHGKKVEYLILQYRHLLWDFPRGHVESGESDTDTAQREIREETGISDLKFTSGFASEQSWTYKTSDTKKKSKKAVVYFLAEVDNKTVTLQEENLQYKWLPLDDVLALPSFPHVQRVIREADSFIAQHK